MFNRKPGKRALAFIFLTVFIDMIGLAIIIPVMPQLIMELTGEPLAQAARYGGLLLLIYATMQFFMSPVIGNLSDRYGRRPVLLLSLLGYAIDYSIMGLAPALSWLFIGRMFSGAFAATYATANAYVADVSTPETRAGNFGIMGAAFGLGFIIGPVIGGFLGEISPRAPFFAASGLAFLNFLYGFFVLPETLPKEKRRKFEWRRANPLGSLLQMRVHPVVIGILGALFLVQLAHMSLPAVWSYFSIEKFGWSERDIGFSLAFVGLTSAIVQAGLTRKVVPRIGEVRAASLGIGAMALSLLAYAFAQAGWQVYAALAFGSIAGFIMPSFMAVMSKRLPENEQGELQGAIASIQAMVMIITPLGMTQIFAFFTESGTSLYFPGAPFFLGAILAALALPIFLTAVAVREADAPAE
ncbi:MAG: tetracycline resistance MFS efflux pump [Parvularculaceae bacterium]